MCVCVCVQPHHNQALMCEDSGEITRSYPSFITLRKDTPNPLITFLFPLPICFFLIFSPPFFFFFFFLSLMCVYASLLLHYTPLFKCFTMCLFCRRPGLLFDMLCHLNLPPVFTLFFWKTEGTRTDCLICQCDATHPSARPTSSFLAVCQGIDESTGRTGLIYRHFRLFHRHFTFPR